MCDGLSKASLKNEQESEQVTEKRAVNQVKMQTKLENWAEVKGKGDVQQKWTKIKRRKQNEE